MYYSRMEENGKQEKLAELLYAAMTKRKMSIQGLASAVGVQRQTCYAWLHEQQRPSLEMLRRLSSVLNISFATLVATTHPNVEEARVESLLEVYLDLSKDRRRLIEAIFVVLRDEERRKATLNTDKK